MRWVRYVIPSKVDRSQDLLIFFVLGLGLGVLFFRAGCWVLGALAA